MVQKNLKRSHRRRRSLPNLFSRLRPSHKKLAFSLHHHFGLRKGDIAFVLSPNSIHLSVLSFYIFSLGVVTSPKKSIIFKLEILHQIQLSKPILVFVTSNAAHTIPNLKTIVLDSPEFESLMMSLAHCGEMEGGKVYQLDPGTILYPQGLLVELMEWFWLIEISDAWWP